MFEIIDSWIGQTNRRKLLTDISTWMLACAAFAPMLVDLALANWELVAQVFSSHGLTEARANEVRLTFIALAFFGKFISQYKKPEQKDEDEE